MPGITLTPGKGATVAFDTVGSATTPASGERLQYVKLDAGGGGASAPISSAALADATTNPTLIGVGGYLFGFNGTTWDRLQVDGSKYLKVNVEVSALPTGAATSAKQPALGVAGTASSDVITIQGVASMTKLLVTPDSVALPNHQSTNVDQLNGTTTDTNSGNKSAGTLRVVIATDQPALTNKLLVTPDANITINNNMIVGTTMSINTGNTDNGCQRVVIASNNPAITVTESNLDGSIVAAGTTGPTKSIGVLGKTNDGTPQYQMFPLGAGGRSFIIEGYSGGTGVPVTGTFYQATQPVSGAFYQATQPVSNAGTFAVQATEADGANVTIGSKADAKNMATDTTSITIMSVLKQISASVQAPPSQVVTNAGTFSVQQTPGTSGGLSAKSFISTAAVQTDFAKASAGQVYGVEFFNNTSTPVYLRLYNMATAPASTDTANIIWRGMVPGNAGAAGLVFYIPDGLAFSTGIAFRCTGAIADNDTTVLAANAIVGNILYK